MEVMLVFDIDTDVGFVAESRVPNLRNNVFSTNFCEYGIFV